MMAWCLHGLLWYWRELGLRGRFLMIGLGRLLGPGLLVAMLARTQQPDSVLYISLYAGMLMVGVLLASSVGWLELRRVRRSRSRDDGTVSRL